MFVLDARNHGNSPHSSEMTYELMAKDTAQFIKTHTPAGRGVVIGERERALMYRHINSLHRS